MRGTLSIKRLDGSGGSICKELEKEEAVEQLKVMRSVFPGCYKVEGVHCLDGSIELKFLSTSFMLNDLSFQFTPNTIS